MQSFMINIRVAIFNQILVSFRMNLQESHIAYPYCLGTDAKLIEQSLALNTYTLSILDPPFKTQIHATTR